MGCYFSLYNTNPPGGTVNCTPLRAATDTLVMGRQGITGVFGLETGCFFRGNDLNFIV